MFSELNDERVNTFGIEMDENADFVKLRAWVDTHKGEDLIIHGFLITNGGNYGKSVSVIADAHTFVSLPKRYVEWFEARTPEQIAGIREGKCKLTAFEEVTAKNGSKTIAFKFDDVK